MRSYRAAGNQHNNCAFRSVSPNKKTDAPRAVCTVDICSVLGASSAKSVGLRPSASGYDANQIHRTIRARHQGGHSLDHHPGCCCWFCCCWFWCCCDDDGDGDWGCCGVVVVVVRPIFGGSKSGDADFDIAVVVVAVGAAKLTALSTASFSSCCCCCTDTIAGEVRLSVVVVDADDDEEESLLLSLSEISTSSGTISEPSGGWYRSPNTDDCF